MTPRSQFLTTSPPERRGTLRSDSNPEHMAARRRQDGEVIEDSAPEVTNGRLWATAIIAAWGATGRRLNFRASTVEFRSPDKKTQHLDAKPVGIWMASSRLAMTYRHEGVAARSTHDARQATQFSTKQGSADTAMCRDELLLIR